MNQQRIPTTHRFRTVTSALPNPTNLLSIGRKSFGVGSTKGELRKRGSFRTLKQQQHVMDRIYVDLQLKELKEWLFVSKEKLKEMGANTLLSIYYSNNRKSLFSSIYPNYPWQEHYEELTGVGKALEDTSLKKAQKNLRNLTIQRSFMDKLFSILKLKSLDDWKRVKKSAFLQSSISLTPSDHNTRKRETTMFEGRGMNLGKYLLNLYDNNFEKLLQSLYPHHHWNFHLERAAITKRKKIIPTTTGKIRERHIKTGDSIYKHLKLKSFDEWKSVKPSRFRSLSKKINNYYGNDIPLFLRSIYPNFPWQFETFQGETSRSNFKTITSQREFMDQLFQKLQLRSLDDWKHEEKSLLLHGGVKLLRKYYDSDMKKLLLSIYPQHDWNFDGTIFRKDLHSYKTLAYRKGKLQEMIRRYKIRRKEEWYRMPKYFEDINVFTSLQKIYPEGGWRRKLFAPPTKKSNQFILFLTLRALFSPYHPIENYRHPELQSDNDRALEFDVYFPALNLAFEYQGQQHYDDMPGAFGQFEMFHARDLLKERLAKLNHIQLITIPYWWDQSQSSLLQTISHYPISIPS